ncbi:class II fructose-1,6-bisphosphate aldolase [Vibrio coralliirubri]|uniref:class II fructose-1,6-bisphosphate aldolase n=1 Tax=Vibrio coralliirubri TaxID=1516159 RepID=UPI002283E3E6|nr:class II fructose-1,6-bisphosphate aldolase [Vibrio coralliirubri]MCY9861301.1 class II fructose-1,6-bisphosphate aldolase [Vibrio coralliirubri]
MKEMLLHAKENKYAVGQFNINNLEWVVGVIAAAERTRSPVILGVSGGTIKHMCGFKTITEVVKGVIDYLGATVPIALHLDHGNSFEQCKEALDAGFTSVMFDGSHLPFEENLRITKMVVEYAAKTGASTEAELGRIAGTEDGVHASEVVYADPQECLLLVSETGVDCLAPALGSTHGLYKGKAKLGFPEMKEISELVQVPLVLHGGTGIAHEDMLKAISLGTSKINVNTENMYAWVLSVTELLEDKTKDITDPRKVINHGIESVKDNIEGKIRLFQSNDRY